MDFATIRRHIYPVATPKAPKEAVLIRDERVQRNLSIRAAAKIADVSEGRWRQIERGYQIVTRGTLVPAIGTPETIAKMAWALGIEAEELVTRGRADAAHELDLLTARKGSVFDEHELAEDDLTAEFSPSADSRWLVDLSSLRGFDLSAIERSLVEQAAKMAASEKVHSLLSIRAQVDHKLAAREGDHPLPDDDYSEGDQGPPGDGA